MRTRRLSRCLGCGLSLNLCICSQLPSLSAQTRIVILAHRIELEKSTNTGKLVTRMLGAHAELVQSHEPWQNAHSPSESVVLFPTDDAVPLEELAADVRCVIIPDGTWVQARRIARRHPACANLKKVRLSSTLRSAYTLRRSHLENGLCTLEAVAEVLRVLEADSCAAPLLAAFAHWVERALLIRAGAHNTRAFRSSLPGDAASQSSIHEAESARPAALDPHRI
jgi:DTW domain-containing protein YfiP